VYADVHDESTLAHNGLHAYAQHPLLRSVGIDRTYYAPIQASDFVHYASQVPEEFRFLVKAPAQCTSPWLRRDAIEARPNPHFLDPDFARESFVSPARLGLGHKLGPLVFQFPPLSGWSRRAAEFAERLHEFISRLPPGPLYAVELRDASLLSDVYMQALLDTGARHCIGLHPRQPAIQEQARLLGRLPVWVTAGGNGTGRIVGDVDGDGLLRILAHAPQAVLLNDPDLLTGLQSRMAS